MTEQQSDIADALEMIGISEPRQIVTEVSGFIPVFEVVLHHYKDYMTALVFGRMWQYCNMSDGVCKASLERIGKDLEISAVTVMRHAEKLVADGYLIDTTPDRRNAPHEYLDGRRVEMKSRISAGMTESKPTVIKSNASVIKSKLIKQDNTNIKEPLSPEYREQADRKVDAIIEQSRKAAQHEGYWQGRENIPPHLLKYADWWNKRTGQEMKGKVKADYLKEWTAWNDDELPLSALNEAFDYVNGWKSRQGGRVAHPREITKDAAGFAANPKREETKPIQGGFYG